MAKRTCGDCRQLIRDACRCNEHLLICEEQQRAERAEARIEAARVVNEALLDQLSKAGARIARLEAVMEAARAFEASTTGSEIEDYETFRDMQAAVATYDAAERAEEPTDG